MIGNSSIRYKAHIAAENLKVPNRDLDTNAETGLLMGTDNENTVIVMPPSNYTVDTQNQILRLHAQ